MSLTHFRGRASFAQPHIVDSVNATAGEHLPMRSAAASFPFAFFGGSVDDRLAEQRRDPLDVAVDAI